MTCWQDIHLQRMPAFVVGNRVPVYRLKPEDLPFTFAEGDVPVAFGRWRKGGIGQLHTDSDGVRLFNLMGRKYPDGTIRPINGVHYVWRPDGDR